MFTIISLFGYLYEAPYHPDLSGTGPIYRAHRSQSPVPNCPLQIARRSKSSPAPYRPRSCGQSLRQFGAGDPIFAYHPDLSRPSYGPHSWRPPLQIARSSLSIAHRSQLPTHLKARFTAIWSGGRDKSGPYRGRRKRGPYTINRYDTVCYSFVCFSVNCALT
jgi:hypothetical protein